MTHDYLQEFAKAYETRPEQETAFDNYEEIRNLRVAPELFDPIIQLNPEKIQIDVTSRIDGFCKLEGGQGLTIGRYVHIASFCHIGLGGGRTIIEDYVGISSHVSIISGSNLIDGVLSMSAVAPFARRKFDKTKTTTLKKYSGVFANAVVLPGVTLHEGAILGAGGVALEDIPEWQVWAGNPARFIRMRQRP